MVVDIYVHHMSHCGWPRCLGDVGGGADDISFAGRGGGFFLGGNFALRGTTVPSSRRILLLSRLLCFWGSGGGVSQSGNDAGELSWCCNGKYPLF